MSSQSASPAGYGFQGRLNWLISGILGGISGAVTFGGLVWIVDPELIAVVIPMLYGIDPAVISGWLIHLFNGLVLGIVFGFFVSRNPILGLLTTATDTVFPATMGLARRLTLAGLVYGLIIWFILPVLIQPLWLSLWGLESGLPSLGLPSLVGHLLFGTSLGAFFALFVNIEPKAKNAESPVD